MPYFHGSHDGRAAFIEVAIIDAAAYHQHKQSGRPFLRDVKPFKALIDTGATTTMVTHKVIREMGLIPVNKRLWHSSDGEVWRTAYLFQVAFYGETIPIGDSEEDGISAISNLHVCKSVINGGGIDDEPSWDVLLGMDIISTGILTIDKGGSYSFAF
jgi:gag-polyprotein putative aspartyl protease